MKQRYLYLIALWVTVVLLGMQSASFAQQSCPAGSIFGLRPVQPVGEGSIRTWISDSSFNPALSPSPFDNFDVTSQVCRITWWGTESRIVGMVYVPEPRDNTNFAITVYDQTLTSPPHPGTPIFSETVNATRTATGISYPNATNPSNPFPLYRYTAELSLCQSVPNPAWISIVAQGGSLNGAYFVQICAYTPGSVGGGGNGDILRNMRTWNGISYTVRTGDNWDMAFCLETKFIVPNVVNMTQSAAETAITAASLSVGIITHAYSQTVPAGSVISQSPVAGTRLWYGDPVHLTVSLGNPPTPLCPANSIYGMRPALPTEGPRVWVSDDFVGPGNISMPAPYDNFAVLSQVCRVTWWGTEINATTFAADTRLSPEFTITFYANDTSLPAHHPGAILCQHMVTASRTSMHWQYPNSYNPSSPLTLYQYSADLPSCCSVPSPAWISIRGTAAGSANGVVFMQISAYSVSGGGGQNDILRSMREYNAVNLPYRVRTGNNYDMAFCLETKVPVPDVVGLAQADAEAAILAASLTVGAVAQAYSISVPAGDVISQNPAAGTLVLLQTPVDIVVSLGLPPQPCPAGSIFSQPTIGSGQPNTRWWVSDDLAGPGNTTMPAPYDNFSVTQQICAVTWWGAEVDLATLAESERTAPEFTITLYDNDISGGPDPMPGTVVCQYVVTATKSSTGSVYSGPNGPVTLYRYAAELPTCCTVGTGWISIRGTVAGSANGVVFAQVCTDAPSGDMREYNDVDLPYRVAQGINYDMAFCLETKVFVPDVVNMVQADAETAITTAGLTVGTISTQYNPTVPVGHVISQNPDAGTLVPLQTPVDLVISLGPPPPVPVPDVVGMAQAAAEAAITAAGLTVGSVTTQYGPPGSTGKVLSQSPIGGVMVPPGSPVNLIVSLGPAPVPVPNVVGMTLSNAVATLLAADLVVGNVATMYSLTVPAGVIISQDPEAGTIVPYQSAVNLVNSLGLPPVEVPDVVGMTQANAEATILAADLTVGTITEQYDDTVAAGLVISQNPAAGQFALYGSPVHLVISLGPAPVMVPDVVGLMQTDAEAAIIAAGLTVGSITEMYNDLPAGTVISQLPFAGTSVAPGTAVDLVVSLGPEPPRLPATGLFGLMALATVLGAMALARVRRNRPIMLVVLVCALSLLSAVAAAQSTCPTGSIFSQPPTTVPADARIWASDEFIDDLVAQGVVLQKDVPIPFDDYQTSGPIASLVWWGFELSALTPPVYPHGTRTSNHFTITFYTKETFGDPPQPIPGAIAAQYTNLLATKTASGLMFVNPTTFQWMPLWRYSVELPTPCMLTNGFINIKGTLSGSANGVAFVHISSSVGNEYMCEYTGLPEYDPYRIRTGGRRDVAVCMTEALVVPDVVGMMEADAEATILAAGFTMGIITDDYSGATPYGSVLSQSPAAGAFASPGTGVNLLIAREPAIVPLVVGLTQSDAIAQITAAGLVPALTLVYNETIPAGTVILQNPLEGALVAPGSVVRITVSRGPQPANLPITGMGTLAALAIALGIAGTFTHLRRR